MRHYPYKFPFFYFITFSLELFCATRTVLEMNNKLCFHDAHMSHQNQVSLYVFISREHLIFYEAVEMFQEQFDLMKKHIREEEKLKNGDKNLRRDKTF